MATGLSLLWMELGGGRHQLTFTVENAGRLVIPRLSSRERADDLWRETCFELFLRRNAGPAYFEFNFSPSQHWAAYGFDAYRDGMVNYPMAAAPFIQGVFMGDNYVLRGDLSGLPKGMTIAGVSAVLVEVRLSEPDGEDAEPVIEDYIMSYWALSHPAQQPDFHHPASFVMPLAPGQV